MQNFLSVVLSMFLPGTGCKDPDLQTRWGVKHAHDFDLRSFQAVRDVKSTRQIAQAKAMQYMEMLHDHARKVPKLKSNSQPQMQRKKSNKFNIAHVFPSS